MSLFQRSLYGEDPTFTNLFRLLDDFENYSREVQGNGTQAQGQGRQGRHGRRAASFNPKFDVRETETSYELHGELPGLERNDIQMEFTEPQTLVIHGRVERNYSAGTPPAGVVEGSRVTGTITEGNDTSHKATVEDEETEAAKEKGESSAAVETTKKEENRQPRERYWHQERSIGEFYRTFNFPGRIDETKVSANLNNGILHVSVPKASKPETRRITID